MVELPVGYVDGVAVLAKARDVLRAQIGFEEEMSKAPAPCYKSIFDKERLERLTLLEKLMQEGAGLFPSYFPLPLYPGAITKRPWPVMGGGNKVLEVLTDGRQ